MAEYQKQLTDEVAKEVENILSVFDRPTATTHHFSPLYDQFIKDEEEISLLFAPPEEEEEDLTEPFAEDNIFAEGDQGPSIDDLLGDSSQPKETGEPAVADDFLQTPEPESGSDPFAEVPMDTETSSDSLDSDDPFAEVPMDTGTSSDSLYSDDPFAEVPMDTGTSSDSLDSDDPFAEVPMDTGTSSDSISSSGDDPFADFTPAPDTLSDDDDFSDVSGVNDLSFDNAGGDSGGGSGFESEMMAGLGAIDDLEDLGDMSGGSSEIPSFDSGFTSPTPDVTATADTSMDLGDLEEMSRQASLNQGIGDEFTDEELAKIRTALSDYPPGVKKSVIDAVINEKISHPDQRLLMNMLADHAESSTIADFLENRLGYRPDTTASDRRKDGVQIIYADNLSPEDLAARKQKAKWTMIIGALALTGVMIFFGVLFFLHRLSVNQLYDNGLDELKSSLSLRGEEREERRKKALDYYRQALVKSNYNYNLEYMNRYGTAFMKAGYYDDAFDKLFGRVEPAYNWKKENARAPLIRLTATSRWPTKDEIEQGYRPYLTAADGVERKLIEPGGYTAARLRDGEFVKSNLIALALFHSNPTKAFRSRAEGEKYKNDALGTDYYRVILTLMEMPDDVDAKSGIAKIFYDQKEFAAAAREYNQIIDKNPIEIKGHSGLLNTYIEIWKQDQDPRFVIQRHRLIQTLGLEKKLPMYVLAKLAGFYIDLDTDDLRIKYQVDPVDQMTGLNINDNALHILEILFNSSEERDGEKITGSNYGEGFYQRGRFLMKVSDPLRAIRQFQNAHEYDPQHYLAVNSMGEYYKNNLEFDRAIGYFETSVAIHDRYVDNYGIRPEDETLIEGDEGKIYYNLGSISYLRYAGVGKNNPEGFSGPKIYPERSRGLESDDLIKRRESLARARDYFKKALDENIKDEKARINIYYWNGWINYTEGDFESALTSWEELDHIYSESDSDHTLLMARGNSYFYTDQNRSAMSQYLKVISDLDVESAQIARPDVANIRHRLLYEMLAAASNNMGAVYEKEHNELIERGGSAKTAEQLEAKAIAHYWKSVETSQKIEIANEIARTNQQLAFRSRGKQIRLPLLDDWVSPMLSSNR